MCPLSDEVTAINQAIAQRALLVLNRHSRRGGAVNLEGGVATLMDAGFAITPIESTSTLQTKREIAARHREIDFVIIGGGDGTVSALADTLYRYHLPFALLPLGTANDLARSIGIPEDLDAAWQIITDNRRRKIDLGVVNGHYFFNAAHIGLGASVRRELSAADKKTWGIFSYFKALTVALTRARDFRVKLTIDGKRYRKRAIQLTIGNGRYYGGGNVVDEYASIENGLLCLYAIKPQSLWGLVKLAPFLRSGRQRHADGTFAKMGRRIEVKTAKPMPVQADGEPATQTPAVVEVIPRALEIFAPGNKS